MNPTNKTNHEPLSIGTKIKKLRELRNYTQEYMAEQLDMSHIGYGKIERNETEVTYRKLEEIAKILDMKVIDLVGFDDAQCFVNISHNSNSNNNSNLGQIHISPNEKNSTEKISFLEKEIDYLKQIIALQSAYSTEKPQVNT